MRPILLIMVLIPIVFLVPPFILTGFFSTKPPYPPLLSKITPLILNLLAIVVSFFGYTMTKDEEPEWGESLAPYKLLEAVYVAYTALAAISSLMIIVLYFL